MGLLRCLNRVGLGAVQLRVPDWRPGARGLLLSVRSDHDREHPEQVLGRHFAAAGCTHQPGRRPERIGHHLVVDGQRSDRCVRAGQEHRSGLRHLQCRRPGRRRHQLQRRRIERRCLLLPARCRRRQRQLAVRLRQRRHDLLRRARCGAPGLSGPLAFGRSLGRNRVRHDRYLQRDFCQRPDARVVGRDHQRSQHVGDVQRQQPACQRAISSDRHRLLNRRVDVPDQRLREQQHRIWWQRYSSADATAGDRQFLVGRLRGRHLERHGIRITADQPQLKHQHLGLLGTHPSRQPPDAVPQRCADRSTERPACYCDGQHQRLHRRAEQRSLLPRRQSAGRGPLYPCAFQHRSAQRLCGRAQWDRADASRATAGRAYELLCRSVGIGGKSFLDGQRHDVQLHSVQKQRSQFRYLGLDHPTARHQPLHRHRPRPGRRLLPTSRDELRRAVAVRIGERGDDLVCGAGEWAHWPARSLAAGRDLGHHGLGHVRHLQRLLRQRSHAGIGRGPRQ